VSIKGVSKIQNLIYLSTIIILLIISYIDFKTKTIPLKYNIIIGCLGTLNLLLNITNFKLYIFSTIIVFSIFTIIAIVTNGAIGGGDIKLLTALTLIFGENIFFIVFYTYILTAVIAIVMILIKKCKLKSSVALAPFITLGTLIYFMI